ncbi:MAG TPA: hypothetical protein VJ276_02135 [Thermoanaerobaculia bacterium]|nr:hypothetical protein [Thermoanaerobaculia bacterium]
MSTSVKYLLGFALVALLCAAAPAAKAQIACDECDPYFSSCSEDCWYCFGFNPDGSCLNTRYSTCGQRSAGCIPDTCSPSFYESNREYRGSYGNGDFHWTYWECTHHVVEWVTVTDANACNTNAAYRSYGYCDDTIDHSESGSGYQDCCDGGWYCDGHHSC